MSRVKISTCRLYFWGWLYPKCRPEDLVPPLIGRCRRNPFLKRWGLISRSHAYGTCQFSRLPLTSFPAGNSPVHGTLFGQVEDRYLRVGPVLSRFESRYELSWS